MSHVVRLCGRFSDCGFCGGNLAKIWVCIYLNKTKYIQKCFGIDRTATLFEVNQAQVIEIMKCPINHAYLIMHIKFHFLYTSFHLWEMIYPLEQLMKC